MAEASKEESKIEEKKKRTKEFEQLYKKIGLSIGVFTYLDHNKKLEQPADSFFPDRTQEKVNTIPYQNWAIYKGVKGGENAHMGCPNPEGCSDVTKCSKIKDCPAVKNCMNFLENDVLMGGYKVSEVLKFGLNEEKNSQKKSAKDSTKSDDKDYFTKAKYAIKFLNDLYTIVRNKMDPFGKLSIDSEYSIYTQDDKEGKKNKPDYGYVNYGRCVAYQLIWRYMHYHKNSDNNDYEKSPIETEVHELIEKRECLKKIKKEFFRSLESQYWEENWKRDINHIFFKCTDGLHFLAFKNYISNLSSDEELQSLPENIVRDSEGKVAEDIVTKITNATKSLIDKFKIKIFADLHTKARFLIVPYYYWNAICEQHQTHLMLPVWRDEEKVTSIGMASIKPWKEDPTLPKSVDYSTLLSDRELTCRAMLAVGRLLVNRFVYRKRQDELKRTTSRAAVAAVMGRNMSHNIGSHVLARYAEEISKEGSFLRGTINSGKEDSRTIFLNYLQRRMDFIAEVSTVSSGAGQFQTLNLGDALSVLDYKKQQARIGSTIRVDGQIRNDRDNINVKINRKDVTYGINGFPVLLEYISGKDGLRATVELDPDLSSISFNCPGGEVGMHALYIILENIIRNSVRHNDIDQKKTNDIPHADVDGDRIEIKIKVKADTNKSDKFLRLEIIDCQSKLKNKETVSKINNILNEPLVDEAESDNINKSNWGIREMKVAAYYLRGLPLEGLDKNSNKKQKSKDPKVIQAIAVEELLTYKIWLSKPKHCFLLEPETIDDNINRENLKKKGIYIVKKSQFKNYKSNLHEYEFVLLPVEESRDPCLKLPVRTFSYGKGEYIKDINDIIGKGGYIKDISDIRNLLGKDILIEKLHELMWKKCKEKRWQEEKKIKILVAWLNMDTCLPKVEDGEKNSYEHTSRGRLTDKFLKQNNDPKLPKVLEESDIGLLWVDHATHQEFPPSDPETELYPGFERKELVSSMSPHNGLLEEHRRLLLKEPTKPPPLPNELLAAALPKILVLDERVQRKFSNEHREIKFESIWRNSGITVPDPRVIDLNDTKDAIAGKATKFFESFFKEDTADFVVMHLGLLEKIAGTNNSRLNNILKIFSESDCFFVLITGRGLTKSKIFSALKKNPVLNKHFIRYLPVSSLQEYLTINPSKLALMRALWTAVPITKFST